MTCSTYGSQAMIPGRAEAADTGGEGAADVAEADDADRVAGDPPHAREVRGHRFPIPAPGALAGGAHSVDHAPRQCEHQRHGVVRHLGRVRPGHVRDQDAEFGRGVEVDRVDADSEPADHLELRTPLEHGARSQRHDADQGAVGVVQQVGQIVFAPADAVHRLEALPFDQIPAVEGTPLHRYSQQLLPVCRA